MATTTNITNAVRQAPLKHIPIRKAATVEDDKKKLHKAAKDMESLFLYQILKAMRKTVPENELTKGLGFGSGLGKDIYGEIFDEELAKKMSGNGEKSLATLLYKSLEKTIEKQSAVGEKHSNSVREILPKAKYLKITDGEKGPIKIETKSKAIPLNNMRDGVSGAGRESASMKPVKNVTDEADRPDIINNQVMKSAARPAVEEIQENPEADTVMGRFGDIIREASEKYRLSPELLESIIKAESAGNPGAISSAGAKGLMQLADTTASDMGVRDAFDPGENIHAGAKYLRWLIDKFGDLKKALAAYNAGPETVKRYNGIPPYQETRKYVQTVISGLPDKRHFYD